MTGRFNHHILIVNDGYQIKAKYSRCSDSLCDGNTWEYYFRQCIEEKLILLAVVEDTRHEHPQVITMYGLQDNSDKAHML